MPPNPLPSPAAPPLLAAPPSPPDATLVTATLAGDPAAYAQLATRYERPARATCYAVLHDWHAAQDAAQDAFLHAYTHLRSLRSPSTFGPWLLTIAHRRASYLAKRRPHHRPLDSSPEPPARPPSPDPAEPLLDLIATLPDHERTLLLLRYVDDHPVSHIAHLLSRPVGTITKQLSRAHARLRTRLTEKGAHP